MRKGRGRLWLKIKTNGLERKREGEPDKIRFTGNCSVLQVSCDRQMQNLQSGNVRLDVRVQCCKLEGMESK